MADRTSIDPILRTPGRGAQGNVAGRFERLETIFEDDGWEPEQGEQVARTQVANETARSIISYNRSPDLPFDRALNAYRGCEHGCIYCFARPTHAWLGLSAGLDFETRLVARPNAPELLAKQLRARKYRVATLAIGTNTDPYQPIERGYEITRQCLQVLEDFRHPVAVVTKGTLIERDIDILSRMARDGLARVGISVTTLDATLSRAMEPRAPSPRRRLAIIRRLSEAGIPVRIMTSPLVPGLSDHELEALLAAGKAAGASSASWIMLRLPREVSQLFQDWLAVHFPDRAARVMGHLRAMHGGKVYDADWGRRMRGEGPYAQIIAARFEVARKRLALASQLPPLRNDLFRVPVMPGDQADLFETKPGE